MATSQKKETVEQCIKQEATGDLINVHNFLTSIFIHDTENRSVFALSLELMLELKARAKKEENAAVYLQAMEKLLDMPAEYSAQLKEVVERMDKRLKAEKKKA